MKNSRPRRRSVEINNERGDRRPVIIVIDQNPDRPDSLCSHHIDNLAVLQIGESTP